MNGVLLEVMKKISGRRVVVGTVVGGILLVSLFWYAAWRLDPMSDSAIKDNCLMEAILSPLSAPDTIDSIYVDCLARFGLVEEGDPENTVAPLDVYSEDVI